MKSGRPLFMCMRDLIHTVYNTLNYSNRTTTHSDVTHSADVQLYRLLANKKGGHVCILQRKLATKVCF